MSLLEAVDAWVNIREPPETFYFQSLILLQLCILLQCRNMMVSEHWSINSNRRRCERFSRGNFIPSPWSLCFWPPVKSYEWVNHFALEVRAWVAWRTRIAMFWFAKFGQDTRKCNVVMVHPICILVMALFIVFGLNGIEKEQKLSWKDCWDCLSSETKGKLAIFSQL